MPRQTATVTATASVSWDPFLDSLQLRTLNFFLETTDPNTGLTPDRWPSPSPSSIAAVGFALTSYAIAVERELITREEAAQRTLKTLRFFWQLPQHDQPQNVGGYKGFFYHFLKIPNGTREWNCELSTIDTALLMAGVLFAQSYFDADNTNENDIRNLADSLYFRIDWKWAMADTNGVKTSWRPEQGFGKYIWDGYDEAMMLYILALGSPAHPVPESVWQVWTKPYVWAKYYDQEFVSFGPLFGHQYSHGWIDSRNIQDDYMRNRGITYFENSRRAARAYCIANPRRWVGYGENVWGITACDGPNGYAARGAPPTQNDDGTIAPTAAANSIPFTPKESLAALRYMYDTYYSKIWMKYSGRQRIGWRRAHCCV
ncbi:MAG: glucoamylase family protein [bacterium]